MNQPLFDAYAEQRLVGAVAIAPDLFGHAAYLAPGDFYNVENRAAWARLVETIGHGRAVIPSDYATFYSGDVVALPDFVAEDARRVALYSTARAAIEAASLIARKAYALEESELAEAIRAAQAILSRRRVGRILTAAEVVTELRETLERDDNSAFVPTGLGVLDKALGIGLERQTLSILMARPSMGKTAVLAQISDLVSQAGRRVIVFSREMSRLQWARRIVFRRARVNYQDWKQSKLSKNDLARLVAELNNVYERASLLFDGNDGSQTSDDVIAACEEVERKYGKLDMVLIDHLRLFSDKADNENHRQGRISWNLKQLARRLNVPVLCAAQLSRAVESMADKRPTLRDLRDSGEIEENADNVIALYREKYYNPDANNVIEFIFRKFRDGEINSQAHMAWIEPYSSLEALAYDPH